MLSYILILLNTIYGLLLMPYIVGQLGNAEYGVYKTITAFTSALMVLDLGMGSTATRYIAKALAENNQKRISDCVKIFALQGAVLSVVVFGISLGVYFSLDTIYRHGLTAAELVLAKKLFLLMIITVVLHIFENILHGIIAGFNRYIFANSLKVIRLISRILLTFFILNFFRSSLVLVLIDIALIAALLLSEVVYIRKKLCIQKSSAPVDTFLFWDTLKYSLSVFAISVVSQISSNLDSVIVGAVKSSVAVTVYSIALQLYNMFLQIGSSISGVMLPPVIRTLQTDDPKMSKTEQLVVQTGRIQFMLLAAAFAGFLVVGKDFIQILMGSPNYTDAYYLGIILMFPAIFEVCINVCLSILRAKKDLGYYVKALVLSAIINLLISLIGTILFNYYAAAIGTAASVIIGNLLLMNRYYHKKFGFSVRRIYQKIMRNTWICVVAAALVSWLFPAFGSSWTTFLSKTGIFLLVYLAGLLLFGLNKEEKQFLLSSVKHRRKES